MIDLNKMMKVLVIQGALLSSGGCKTTTSEIVPMSPAPLTKTNCIETCSGDASSGLFCPEPNLPASSNCCWLMAPPRHECCAVLNPDRYGQR